MKTYYREFTLIILYMGTITYLSGGAGPQLPVQFIGIDKLGHFIVFGFLGILFTRLSPFVNTPKGKLKRLLFASTMTTLFGLSDEIHQATNPLRYFEWWDLTADFLGAICFSYLYISNKTLRKWGELSLRELAGKIRIAKVNFQ